MTPFKIHVTLEKLYTHITRVLHKGGLAHKKKSDQLLKVEKVKANIAYYSKLLYQMSKEINSLFNTNCRRTITYNRRSQKNDVTNTISLTTNLIQSSNTHDTYLVDYIRCYVEDYMQISIGDTLLILIPTSYANNKIEPCCRILKSDLSKK